MSTTYRKIVKGYTAQARFYASQMERPDGSWLQLGWTPDRRGDKAVWQLLDGTAVAIYDGTSHLSIVIQEIAAENIYATEEALYAARDRANATTDAPFPCDIGTMGHLKGGF